MQQLGAGVPPVCGPTCSSVYNGTWDGLRKIARREGMRVLWRGTDVALMMAIPMVRPLLWAIHDAPGRGDAPGLGNVCNSAVRGQRCGPMLLDLLSTAALLLTRCLRCASRLPGNSILHAAAAAHSYSY